MSNLVTMGLGPNQGSTIELLGVTIAVTVDELNVAVTVDDIDVAVNLEDS